MLIGDKQYLSTLGQPQPQTPAERIPPGDSRVSGEEAPLVGQLQGPGAGGAEPFQLAGCYADVLQLSRTADQLSTAKDAASQQRSLRSKFG